MAASLTDEILEFLPRKVREIVHQRYWELMTFAEIGRAHQLSASRVSQIHDEWIDAIRHHFQGESREEAKPIE